MKKQILIGAALLAVGPALYGQIPAEYGKTVFQFAGIGNVFGSETLGSRIVTGKPFSATEERHSIQILGDGTHIETSEANHLYRDDQGRTRIESSNGSVKIFDPVAGFRAELNPVTKAVTMVTVAVRQNSIGRGGRGGEISAVVTDPATTAKLQAELQQTLSQYTPASPQVVQLKKQIAELQATQKQATVTLPMAFSTKLDAEAVYRTVTVTAGDGPVTLQVGSGDNGSVERLAEQKINGALAQGTRTTETIPAGKIGNDRPINILNERWFSNDLQLLVKSTSSDPRFGDTTYQLTNIVQASPDPSLFQIPADYTIRK